MTHVPARAVWHHPDTAIDQLGYVVDDIDAALRYWTGVVGAGPFFLTRRTEPRPVKFRGQNIEIINSTALGFVGQTQVELIQQHCSTPSSYREFIDVQGPGLHHVAKFSPTYDDDVASYEAAGLEYVMGGSAGTDIRYSYWEHPDTPKGAPILELVTLGVDIRTTVDMIKGAAASWDGVTDPVVEYASQSSSAD